MKKSTLLSSFISQTLFAALLPVFLKLFSYLHPIVLGVVWLSSTLCVFFVVFFIRKTYIVVPNKIFYFFCMIYSVCLFFLLFFRPSDQSYGEANLIPFETIVFYLSGEVSILVAFYNIAANIGLFIPYGVLIVLTIKNRLKKFFIPTFIIFIIEISQFFSLRGSFDIDDLILNILGVYIGIWIYPIVSQVISFKKNVRL